MRRALPLLLALAGCQTVWVPAEPGTKTQADFQKDAYECERDAAVVRDGFQAAGMRDRCMRVHGWVPK
jgi:hypothetical protein